MANQSTGAVAETPAPSTRGAMRPTHATVFWRTFVPWQVIRFLIINFKISMMILKSHDTKLAARLPAAGSDAKR